MLIGLFSESPTTGPEVRFHIRGPKPQHSVVGEGVSITCSIAAPDVDETFEMLVDGISYRRVSWHDSGHNAHYSRERLDNGTFVTEIGISFHEFPAKKNLTVIRCFSLKYDGEISLTINVQPAHASKFYPLTSTLVFSTSALIIHLISIGIF